MIPAVSLSLLLLWLPAGANAIDAEPPEVAKTARAYLNAMSGGGNEDDKELLLGGATANAQLFSLAIGGYGLWYYLLTRSSATAASSLHFLMPPLGLFFGWLLLGESVPPLDFLGIAPIALGIWLVRITPQALFYKLTLIMLFLLSVELVRSGAIDLWF